MITTGGTGGHVFPGLAVAARLIARGWRVFWLGTREGMEAKLVPQHGVEFEGIRFAGVRGKGAAPLLLGPFALLSALLQSLSIIRRRAPDVVLGFGGFASFPGGADGRGLRQAPGDPRRECHRGPRQPHSRLRRRPHPARVSGRALGPPRGQGGVGGQPGARRHRRRGAAGSALSRPRGAAAAARARRQPGRGGAQRARAGRARAPVRGIAPDRHPSGRRKRISKRFAPRTPRPASRPSACHSSPTWRGAMRWPTW